MVVIKINYQVVSSLLIDDAVDVHVDDVVSAVVELSFIYPTYLGK